MSQPLSPLAARLALQVAAAGDKRIPIDELLASAQEHDLSLVGDPTARARFRQAWDGLAGTFVVTLPAVASRSGWDAAVEPRLPVWVMRIDREAPESAVKQCGGPALRGRDQGDSM